MLDKSYDESFSLRKIEGSYQDNFNDNIEVSLDKVKILDFSNSIDRWEQELLFSSKGFYSLKGKDVENKTKEFYKELKSFVSLKFSEMKLKNPQSLDIITDIKEKKLQAILGQMQKYENEQISFWETQVYEQGIHLAINRAILYKDNEQIVISSLNNGLSIIKNLAQKENWNDKTLNSKIQVFQAEFFLNLINAYIEDKDLKAAIIFEKYKHKLNLDDKEKLHEIIANLKNKIIAYNWSKELFSYNLSEAENKREINSISDVELKSLVQTLMKEFQEQKKKKEEKELQEKNEENWKKIISALENEPEKAFLYIDASLDKKHQRSKENYIKSILKKGRIETDKKKFLEILNEIYVDFSAFKGKSFSDYREVLSKEDYELIIKLQKMSFDELNFYRSDFAFLKEKLDENKIDKEEDIYSFIQFLISLKNTYSSMNKKEIDFEEREKLIEIALKRFVKKDREE